MYLRRPAATQAFELYTLKQYSTKQYNLFLSFLQTILLILLCGLSVLGDEINTRAGGTRGGKDSKNISGQAQVVRAALAGSARCQ